MSSAENDPHAVIRRSLCTVPIDFLLSAIASALILLLVQPGPLLFSIAILCGLACGHVCLKGLKDPPERHFGTTLLLGAALYLPLASLTIPDSPDYWMHFLMHLCLFLALRSTAQYLYLTLCRHRYLRRPPQPSQAEPPRPPGP